MLGSAIGGTGREASVWGGRGRVGNNGDENSALHLGAVLGRPGNSPLIISGHGEMDTSIKDGWGGVFPLAKDLSTLAFSTCASPWRCSCFIMTFCRGR